MKQGIVSWFNDRNHHGFIGRTFFTLVLCIFVMGLLTTSCHATTTCGDTSIEANNDSFSGYVRAAAPCVPAVDSTVTDCQAYIGSGHTGPLTCAVYDSDGTSEQPGTLICANATGVTPAANSWNVVSLSGCGTLLAHHLYWIAFNSDSGDNMKYIGAGHTYDYSKANGSFDNPFNSSPGTPALTYSLYLDITPTGTSYAQCGYTAVGVNNDTFGGYVRAASACVSSANATVADCAAYIRSSPSDPLGCAIYDSDGSGGQPGTLLCSNTVPVIPGWTDTWNFVPLSGCGTLISGHTYWIAFNANSGDGMKYDSAGTTYYYSKSCCTFDSTFSGSAGSNSTEYSLYLDVTLSLPTPRHQIITTTADFIIPPWGTGPMPQMMWVGSRAMEPTLTDTTVEANVNAMIANGMFDAGFNWAGNDANWSGSRDGSNELVTSSYYPGGMAALYAYIHAHHMKAFTYLAPGSTGCGSFPADQGLYQTLDANLVASFGADGVKYDDCASFGSNLAAQTAYATERLALVAAGRQFYFDVSVADGSLGNYSSPAWAGLVGGNDVWTNFDSGAMTWTILTTEVDAQISNSYGTLARPGRYNLMDFLGVCGDTSLTSTEAQSNFSLFAILKSPLLASGDFSSDATCTAAGTIAILTNGEIIAVNQDSLGVEGTRISQASCGSSTCDVYAVPLSGSAGGATYAVVLWNRASTSQNITVTFSTLPGSPGSSYYVRDLVAHSNLLGSPASTSYTFNSIPSHGVATLALCASQCSAL